MSFACFGANRKLGRWNPLTSDPSIKLDDDEVLPYRARRCTRTRRFALRPFCRVVQFYVLVYTNAEKVRRGANPIKCHHIRGQPLGI